MDLSAAKQKRKGEAQLRKLAADNGFFNGRRRGTDTACNRSCGQQVQAENDVDSGVKADGVVERTVFASTKTKTICCYSF